MGQPRVFLRVGRALCLQVYSFKEVARKKDIFFSHGEII
jgi:hypothetical protein